MTIARDVPLTQTGPDGHGGLLAWLNAPERRGPLLVAPALITLFVMNIFPLLWSFGLGFYNYRANRLSVPRFKGLDNYERVLSDPVVWERFQTTGLIVGSSVGLQLIIGFGLAMLFAKEFPMRRVLIMLVLTPMMLSFVSVAIFFKLFYDPTLGLLSWALGTVTGEPFALLSTPAGAIAGIVIAAIMSAAMSTVDSQLMVVSTTLVNSRIFKERHVLPLSRVAVIVVGTIAALLALDPESTVFGTVSLAWAGIGASIGPAVLFCLFHKNTTNYGLVAGVLTGMITTVIWYVLGKMFPETIFGTVYALLPGFVLSSIATWVTSQFKLDLTARERFDTFKIALHSKSTS